jgi:hypothetical protein
MVDNFTPEELMSQAMDLLDENYDPEEDSFFVVVTKDGKDQRTAFSGGQAIIGELNLKSLSAFIVEAVSTLCRSLGIHPYMFVCRHILAHFIDSERAIFSQLIANQQPDQEEDNVVGDPRDVDVDLVEELAEGLERMGKGEELEKVFIVSNEGMDLEN